MVGKPTKCSPGQARPHGHAAACWIATVINGFVRADTPPRGREKRPRASRPPNEQNTQDPEGAVGQRRKPRKLPHTNPKRQPRTGHRNQAQQSYAQATTTATPREPMPNNQPKQTHRTTQPDPANPTKPTKLPAVGLQSGRGHRLLKIAGGWVAKGMA